MLDREVAEFSNEWERVVRQLQARQMPPVGEDRPAEREVDRMMTALIRAVICRGMKRAIGFYLLLVGPESVSDFPSARALRSREPGGGGALAR